MHLNLIVVIFAGANIHGVMLIMAIVITTNTTTTTFTAPGDHTQVDHTAVGTQVDHHHEPRISRLINLIVVILAGANIHGAMLIMAIVITTSTTTTMFTAPGDHTAVGTQVDHHHNPRISRQPVPTS